MLAIDPNKPFNFVAKKKKRSKEAVQSVLSEAPQDRGQLSRSVIIIDKDNQAKKSQDKFLILDQQNMELTHEPSFADVKLKLSTKHQVMPKREVSKVHQWLD